MCTAYQMDKNERYFFFHEIIIYYVEKWYDLNQFTVDVSSWKAENFLYMNGYFFLFFACLHLTQPPPLEKSSHASRFRYALDFKIDANRIFHKWSNYIVSNKHHYLAAEGEIFYSVCFWCSIIQVQVQWPCARVLPRSGSRPRLWEARTV